MSLTAGNAVACSVFHTINKNNDVFVGRNFDWDNDEGNLWFLPGSKDKNSIAIFEQNGVSMPYEGINNKGLFVAIAAVPKANTPFSAFKPMINSLDMVKIVLEQADSVEEAIKIFPEYTVVFGAFFGYPRVHYKIVDAKGNSAIVEYIDNQIIVIRDVDHCRIMTNHYISNHDLGSDSKTSFKRYNIAVNKLTVPHNTIDDAQQTLKAISQDCTVWSNVYDLSKQKIYVTYKNLEPIILDLKKQFSPGEHGYRLSELNDNDKSSLAYTENKFRFRPHFGYGVVEGENVFHYGGRILLHASNTQKYGLEFIKFDGNKDQFISIGLVAEQRCFEWLNISFGPLGYFDYGAASKYTIGLTTGIGWEPDNHIPFKPLVAYRNDVIFADSTDVVHSISVGFAMDF